MNTKNFIKTVCFTVMALLVINFTSSAEAIQVKMPTGSCPAGVPAGTKCAGGYTLNDMGVFDEADVWHWDSNFVATADISGLAPGWEESLKPTRTKLNSLVGGLSYREFAQNSAPTQIRLILSGSKVGVTQISYPSLYLVECFKPGSPDPSLISTPCFNNPDTTVVNIGMMPQRIWNSYGGRLITMDEIVSVQWTERNLFASKYYTELGPYINVTYDPSKNFWKYNMPWVNLQDIHFRWTNVVPVEGEDISIKVTLADGNVLLGSGKVMSLDVMPKIDGVITKTSYSITKEADKKSGKIVIKAEEIQEAVNNISLRFIPDPAGGSALVIQWPEPDIALFGGLDLGTGNTYYLKAFVGVKNDSGFDPTALTYQDCYLWIDVPPQMGTIVIDGPTYDAFLAKVATYGYTVNDLIVQLHYGQRFNSVPPYSMTWQNRGISSPVPLIPKP